MIRYLQLCFLVVLFAVILPVEGGLEPAGGLHVARLHRQVVNEVLVRPRARGVAVAAVREREGLPVVGH